MLRFLHVLACLVVLVNAVPLEKTLHFSAQSENAVVETAGAAGDPVKTRVSTHSLILDHGSARKKIEVRITKDFIKKHVPVMIPVSTTPLPAPVSEKPHLLPAHTHEHATAAPPHIHAHERIAGTNTRPVVTPALAHSHEHLRDASVHHGGHIHITPIHSHERAAAEPVHPQEHVSAPSHPHGHDHATLIRAPAHVIATPGHSHAHTTAAPLPPIVKSHEESPIVINNGTLSGILRKLLAGDIKSAHLSGKQVVKDLAGKSVAVVISASMHVVDLGDLQSPGSSHVAISHFGHNDSSLLASVLKPLAALAHLKGHVFAGAKHHKSCAAKTSHLLPGIVVLSTPKPSVTTPSSATKQEQTPPKIIPARIKLPESQLPAGDQTSSVPPPAEVLPTAADSY